MPKHQLDQAMTYASDIGVLGVLRVVSRLRGLILLPIIGRGLGTSTYGAWTQSLVVVSVGSAIILFQLDVALVRFVSGLRDKSEQSAVFVPLLVFVVVLGLVFALIALLFSSVLAQRVLGDAVYWKVAQWLGLWTAFSALGSLGIQLQRALRRIKLSGLLATLDSLGQLLVVAAVVLVSKELYSAVQAAVAWEGLFAVVVIAYGFRSVGASWPRFASLRRSLEFSLPLVPAYLSGTVLNYADRFFVAATLGAEAVGIYAAAYSLARVVREPYMPIGTALLPTVSRAWDEGDRGQARWVLSSTIRYYLAIGIPALVGLSVLGPQVLRMLSTDAIAREVGWLIPFMALGYLFSATQSVTSVGLQLVQDTRALAFSRGASALTYILLVAIGVSQWGLIGGAVATAAGFSLDLTFTYLFLRRVDGFPLPLGPSLKSVIASAGMAVAVELLRRPGVVGIAFAVGVGVVVYLGLLIVLGGVGRRELSFARSVLYGHGSSQEDGPN